MWKKSKQINDLQKQRYYGVTFINVKVNQVNGVIAGSNSPELSMPTPYLELVEKIKTYFSVGDETDNSALQQFRNHMSALNGYLAFCGKTIEANIGIELSSQFDEKLRTFLASIDVAPRTRTDRAAQLKTIRRLHQQSISGKRKKDLEGTLAELLRKHVANTGIAPKTLAKQVGVDPTTLSRWIAGTKPRSDTIPALRRLESHFQLDRDTFVALISKPEANKTSAVIQPSHRKRQSERTVRGLDFSDAELTPTFLTEWRALLEYKVSSFPTLQRYAKGTWRLIPKSMATSYGKNVERGAMVCPSAAIALLKLRSFLGVISRLPVDAGGLEWREAPSQTLALCAHPRLLECYLQWLCDKSDGIRHDGHRVFAQFIASLLRPQTGYLWQQPGIFLARLPEALRPSTDECWKKMCESSHDYLRRYIATATGTSRHPEEPICDLLALDDPFQPIFDAIEKINVDAADSPPGGVSQARHKRDALLLALLLSNPLRIRSIASLTWLPNGQGSVRGNSSVGWRIVLQPAQLKNGNSKGARAYNVKVADWVKPILDEYVEEYRETLLAGVQSNYLFAGDRKGGFWKGISGTVLRLTRHYIPGSPGFGPHAFRHLVATTWLRKNPGDFLTVAELLNDTLSTVLANYAHLRRDDSFARYEAQVSKLSR